ncbi:hypothetical protein EYF80_045404 [Liparis tanakae]|uniref:Uncharacterized protein n=1 Tax=Liparis tanakae TaxID=230148 RepID=A0A4Z2FTS3_9TELE|nr:hypothetical protein EYF80_045404 [Liparis tanakae]
MEACSCSPGGVALEAWHWRRGLGGGAMEAVNARPQIWTPACFEVASSTSQVSNTRPAGRIWLVASF